MAGIDFTTMIEDRFRDGFSRSDQRKWDDRSTEVDAYFDALFTPGSHGAYGSAVYGALQNWMDEFGINLKTDMDNEFWRRFSDEYGL